MTNQQGLEQRKAMSAGSGLAMSLCAICVAVLAACGGGGGDTQTSETSTTQPPTPTPTSVLAWKGVTLAGAEFGEANLPGTYGTDYIYPAASSVDYFQAKGMNLVRLPFRWERLQPTLQQPFDSAELARMQEFVAAVTAKGVSVLLDPHNFARYRGGIVGSSEVPSAALADFWSRLAQQFKGNPRVLFGLMNEPHDMVTETWVSAANEAIVAIRAAGAANTITVPGNAWTGAHNWSQSYYGTPNAVAMLQITDSGNNLLFEVHQYLDADSSGTSSTCVSTTIGVERLQGFTAWLKANGKKGLLGEVGGADNAVCNQAVAASLDHLKANADVWAGWLWWAAGPWWGDYMFSIEPTAAGDKPQMSVLAPYL